MPNWREYFYDPYGNVIKVLDGSGHSVDINNDTGFNNAYTYRGYRYDPETGLYFLNARYYAAGIGRFLTKDTFRGVATDPGSLNRYAYCEGDPINNLDPTGHDVGAPGVDATTGIPYDSAGNDAPQNTRWSSHSTKTASQTTSKRGVGVGIEASETTNAGFFNLSAGQNGAIGGAVFSNRSVGAFGSWGGFAKGGTNGPYKSYPSADGQNLYAMGAYAGVGLSVFVTNANGMSDFVGPFRVINFDAGVLWLKGNLQLAYAENGVFVISVGPPPLGASTGADMSSYYTNTWSLFN